MSRHHERIPARLWRRLRSQVLIRDGWRCWRCERYGNEVDHIRPLQFGGIATDPNNLQTLCRACHIAKTRGENRQRWKHRPASPAVAKWRRRVAELSGDVTP